MSKVCDPPGPLTIPFLNCKPFDFNFSTSEERIFFDKTHDLLIVTTAGNYNKWDIEKDAYALVKDYVYPAIKK